MVKCFPGLKTPTTRLDFAKVSKRHVQETKSIKKCLSLRKNRLAFQRIYNNGGLKDVSRTETGEAADNLHNNISTIMVSIFKI